MQLGTTETQSGPQSSHGIRRLLLLLFRDDSWQDIPVKKAEADWPSKCEEPAANRPRIVLRLQRGCLKKSLPSVPHHETASLNAADDL